ncbi:MAG: hypothetical protein M3R14_02940, partial [Acidobacteriota bacterium]|nr:hypothetical protein [Acidobacteriota bacterium]
MKKNNFLGIICTILFILAFGAAAVFPQTTEFSYQGFLSDNSASANGNFDFEFRLFDAANGGTLLGSLQRPNVVVTNGVFSVVLNFGSFPAADRFLEIVVRPSGGGALTTLAPRVKLLSTPYSTHAKNAENAQNAVNSQNATNAQNAQNALTAQNALQLGGTPANQFVLGNDPRLSDARIPLPGSANYIKNSANQQTSSNFNVSGNGTAGGTLTGNIVTASTHFSIGIAPVLQSPGSFNFFAGVLAGNRNTTGSSNSFFGHSAGNFNTTGSNNSYFGFNAGRNNDTGANNSYFGKGAGSSNNEGSSNAFFGTDAGRDNTSGGSNSFFGKGAGQSNEFASGNSFFGTLSGTLNTTGDDNAFFGNGAGESNTTGDDNAFFGAG